MDVIQRGPAQRGPTQRGPAKREPSAAALRKGIRVLLVDDSPSIRQSTEKLLARQGCQISTASDGFDALCQIEEARPEIVFMDAMMPRLDGFQTCALLRSSQQWRDTPVVLVSAGETLLDRVKAELAGANRYLPKPFRGAELLQAIDDFVADAREPD